jgi:hypothetical protein
MHRNLPFSIKKEAILLNLNFNTLAFLILFFTETSYYLLILQTGIVDYFHSDMSQLWMIPVGGVMGILTMAKLSHRSIVVSVSLLFQTLLMLFYPSFNGFMLFALGFLSGLIAPYLIYQLKSVHHILIVLGLSYILGTFAIHIPPENRGVLAICLSIVALFSSYFIAPVTEKKIKRLVLKSYLVIFVWLVLDATLFETLSRSTVGIWKNEAFTTIIATFHIVGLYVGYKLINFKYNNRVILALFAISYLLFAFNLSYLLAIVYPIVISYYNVIILKHFMSLSFEHLTLVSLSLWMSAGIGLSIALLVHHLI